MTSKILEPLNIAGARLPNRVVVTAHGTNIGRGRINDDLIAYHRARARGGAGLIILEILSVHPSTPGPVMINDDLLDAHKRLMAAVAPYGTAIFQQLWHAGHNALPLDGSLPWAPSDIPSPVLGVVPEPMTQAMIDEVVASYADAARRCQEGGLHGVEIHCAHGYLIQQFLSSNTNRREDGYGGSLDNRCRFLLEVLRAIRASVGGDFAVGVRLSPDGAEGGVGIAENRRVLALIQEENLVDYVNVSLGSYYAFPKMIGGMHEPVGYELPTSTLLTRECRVPSLVMGRFRTLEEADQVVRAGQADMVGLTRAHIADPDLVAKSRAGNTERVRPCIACNQGCVGNLMGPEQRLSCVVNPTVGFEARLGEELIEQAADGKSVWVIGGGPAGLEAARVAALRGHRVTLLEASSHLGGMVNLAARLPTRHGLMDYIHWQESELARLGVEVALNRYIEAEDVIAGKPDAVVVATGSLPRAEGLQIRDPGRAITGLDAAHVYSSVELLSRPRKLSGLQALVVDDVGHYEGLGVSEYLLDQGVVKATLITPGAALGPLVEAALMTGPVLDRLGRHGEAFEALTRYRLAAVTAGESLVEPVHGGQARTLAADLVVYIGAPGVNRTLSALLPADTAVQLVGDAHSPRGLQRAVSEGHRAGRSIGSSA